MELDEHRPGGIAGESLGQPPGGERLPCSRRAVEDHLPALFKQALDVFQEGLVEEQVRCGLDKGIDQLSLGFLGLLLLRLAFKQPVEELGLDPASSGKSGSVSWRRASFDSIWRWPGDADNEGTESPSCLSILAFP